MNSLFSIPQLISGGLIANYNCTSTCRHCLYNCSPSRSKAYVDPSRTYELFWRTKAKGARAMHIGGGEPL